MKTIIDKYRTDGSARIQYIWSQKDYFNFFAYSREAKKDSILYEYRKKLRSEMQLLLLRTIHYPIFTFGIIYFLTRQVKSGSLSAIFWGTAGSLFVVSSLHNTGCHYPFEIAYPAHPLIINKRQEAIGKWWYYHPEIIKYELEYLNKKVFKDGFSKQFKTPKGLRYEIAVEDGETYINCIDDFEKIFQFSKDVLKENEFMDMLCPEEFPAHKRIGNI